ncbi:Uncharacterised protein [Legionella lansingensis]|uniref:Uncharacterized protein n=1 Tax=Legionella lansingensis TaxID=45067 RepID=A0A0W0VUF7_9GAMM|nr:hypothetical protein [Legionella lansingensis]KTD23597.1 hypothetical protein Llan_0732 [Legionella lansingensis]SNV52373.1 Uncharacterised protein [Legionella lansingensis]
MLRFFTSSFNRQNLALASVQALNLAAMGAAAYSMISNPETAGEFSLDFLAHLISFRALAPNSTESMELGGLFLNTARLGAIYMGFVNSGCSDVPSAALAGDALFHGVNMMSSLLHTGGKKSEERQHTQTQATVH